MATPVDGGAIQKLEPFAVSDDPASKPNLADESDAYFALIKGVLPSNKFTPDTVYTVPDSALGLTTLQGNNFNNNTGGDYLTYLQKNGSDILAVDGTQVGNVSDADVGDYTALNQYFKHQIP